MTRRERSYGGWLQVEGEKFRHGEEREWAIVPLLPLDAIGPRFRAVATYNGRESKAMGFGGGIWNAHFLGMSNPTETVDLGNLRVWEKGEDKLATPAVLVPETEHKK